jgi:hypothetical protein
MLPYHHRSPDRVSVHGATCTLGSPTLLASCPSQYQNLAGACRTFIQQHLQTIHDTSTIIIHHHDDLAIPPASFDVPPNHHAHHHARPPMHPRPLRVSVTNNISSTGTRSFARNAPSRPSTPPTSAATSPPHHPGNLAVNDGPSSDTAHWVSSLHPLTFIDHRLTFPQTPATRPALPPPSRQGPTWPMSNQASRSGSRSCEANQQS